MWSRFLLVQAQPGNPFPGDEVIAEFRVCLDYPHALHGFQGLTQRGRVDVQLPLDPARRYKFRDRVLQIFGENGKVSFSTFEENHIKLVSSNRDEKFKVPFPKHVQQPLIKTVVEELLGKGTCPSTGNSGARANWVIDQIYKS